jgi:UDP-glucose 4-epimerase
MHVAVTGGAGFIGSYVVSELLERDHTPMVVDKAHGVDITAHSTAVRNAFDRAEAVIHLAGVLGTSELFALPRTAVMANVVGTLNVLEICAERELPFVGITLPDSGWANVYSATKSCARQLASAWHRHAGVPVSHVRAFNVFGPGQKVHGVQKILPTFAHRAWRNEALPIWGDGTQSVDLVHADDVARMLVDALGHGDDVVFDAGTGTSLSVNQVAAWVIQLTGSTAGVEHLPMRAGEEPVEIYARGEGWDRLGWFPVLDTTRFADTVEFYKPERA